MSTKSTILLTKDNEHWYRDGTEITLELSKRNVHVDLNDDEEIIITVTNPDSEIYKVLADLNNDVKIIFSDGPKKTYIKCYGKF